MINKLYAQDVQFSQYYANPLYLNPGLTGKDECPKAVMHYRNQWPAMGKAFTTYSASYDQYFERFGGVGLLTKMDNSGEGLLNRLSASALYSYKTEVNRDISVSAGIEATYLQSSVNWNNLTFGDMIDPRQGFVNQTNEVGGATTRNVDFSTGVVGYTDKIYIGAAVHHLLKPNIGLSSTQPLDRKYTMHGGYVFHITPYNRRTGESQTISVNLLMQQQNNLRNINAGFYYSKTPLVIGFWYRKSENNSDALILLAGLQKKIIKFGYSYDMTLSKIANLTGGSHELSLALQFNCPKKKKKILKINCPTF